MGAELFFLQTPPLIFWFTKTTKIIDMTSQENELVFSSILVCVCVLAHHKLGLQIFVISLRILAAQILGLQNRLHTSTIPQQLCCISCPPVLKVATPFSKIVQQLQCRGNQENPGKKGSSLKSCR